GTDEVSLPTNEGSLASSARTGPVASITPATRPTATIDLHPFIRPPREPLLPGQRSSPKRGTALLGSDYRLGRQESEQVGQGPVDVLGVLRLERQLHGVLGVAELGIRAQQQLRKRRQGGVQVLGDGALALARVDHAQRVGRGGETLPQGLELLLEELRDAG